jgi:hypothetical protein
MAAASLKGSGSVEADGGAAVLGDLEVRFAKDWWPTKLRCSTRIPCTAVTMIQRFSLGFDIQFVHI